MPFSFFANLQCICKELNITMDKLVIVEYNKKTKLWLESRPSLSLADALISLEFYKDSNGRIRRLSVADFIEIVPIWCRAQNAKDDLPDIDDVDSEPDTDQYDFEPEYESDKLSNLCTAENIPYDMLNVVYKEDEEVLNNFCKSVLLSEVLAALDLNDETGAILTLKRLIDMDRNLLMQTPSEGLFISLSPGTTPQNSGIIIIVCNTANNLVKKNCNNMYSKLYNCKSPSKIIMIVSQELVSEGYDLEVTALFEKAEKIIFVITPELIDFKYLSLPISGETDLASARFLRLSEDEYRFQNGSNRFFAVMMPNVNCSATAINWAINAKIYKWPSDRFELARKVCV